MKIRRMRIIFPINDEIVLKVKMRWKESGRMRSILCFVAGGVVCAAVSSCERTPENVMGKEAMASFMADMHMGEAVIDLDYSSFPNDSTRKALKQSICAAHGVDQELVDSSFSWYGHHIEKYIDVYDRTIEIIQERQRNLASSLSSQIAIAGDSVAIWTGPGHVLVSDKMPSRILTFNFEPDSTWQKGDIFMLRYLPVNPTGKIESRIMVDYDNGVTGYISDATVTQRGINEQRLQVDSTLVPTRIYGYITYPANEGSYEIDSIAVVRMRHYIMPHAYLSHKRFTYGMSADELRRRKEANATDSVPADSISATESFPDSVASRPAITTPRSLRRERNNADLPVSSADAAHTEHRQSAAEHKVTPESRKAAANRRSASQQTMQRRQIKKTKD